MSHWLSRQICPTNMSMERRISLLDHVGFFVSETHSFLGTSPDGAIYDPSNPIQPFGFLEAKCPYSQRNQTPIEASSDPRFCCYLKSTGSSHAENQALHL